MKIETSEHGFFKTWTKGNMRIMKDKANTGIYTYEVQRYNGRTWNKVKAYHTLKEAKAAIQ